MNTDPKAPQQDTDRDTTGQPQTVTHNLDTGRDEPLKPASDDEGLIDFASGSDGGSAGDGSAA